MEAGVILEFCSLNLDAARCLPSFTWLKYLECNAVSKQKKANSDDCSWLYPGLCAIITYEVYNYSMRELLIQNSNIILLIDLSFSYLKMYSYLTVFLNYFKWHKCLSGFFVTDFKKRGGSQSDLFTYIILNSNLNSVSIS